MSVTTADAKEAAQLACDLAERELPALPPKDFNARYREIKTTHDLPTLRRGPRSTMEPLIAEVLEFTYASNEESRRVFGGAGGSLATAMLSQEAPLASRAFGDMASRAFAGYRVMVETHHQAVSADTLFRRPDGSEFVMPMMIWRGEGGVLQAGIRYGRFQRRGGAAVLLVAALISAGALAALAMCTRIV